jgi:hypothetical protein
VVEYPRVFRYVGFFVFAELHVRDSRELLDKLMAKSNLSKAQQIAQAAVVRHASQPRPPDLP